MKKDDIGMGCGHPLAAWFWAVCYGGIGIAYILITLRDGSAGPSPFFGVAWLCIAAVWAFRGFWRKRRRRMDQTGTDETTVKYNGGNDNE